MFCEGKSKSVVSLEWKGKKEELIFPSPIDVSTSIIQSSILRVINQGLCNDAWYENFVCGNKIQIFSGGEVCGNQSVGFSIFLNDSLTFTTGIPGTSSGARAGTVSAFLVSKVVHTPGFQSSNFATNCGGISCKLRISDNQKNTLFEKLFSGECPAYFVRCDNDCPPGQHKVETDTYPGYCCLDCKFLANEIRNIRNSIKNI